MIMACTRKLTVGIRPYLADRYSFKMTLIAH
jgi:hypothetical protein